MAALITSDRWLAEEIVQDAFAEVITRWSSIEPDRALAYLYRCVTNGARSALRRRRTANTFRPEPAAPAPGADEQVLQAEGYDAILAAVQQLSPRQRRVVVLRYYAERSVSETADALNISEPAVAVATHHALKALRKMRKDLS